ncbi:hypothetical protein PybrP1_007219 [[Pythium] brassicae (nom. inval.)]|nr:hypothetical protein PybrP1_007219 [[Pythium] brassicae (nom. inval.)]
MPTSSIKDIAAVKAKIVETKLAWARSNGRRQRVHHTQPPAARSKDFFCRIATRFTDNVIVSLEPGTAGLPSRGLAGVMEAGSGGGNGTGRIMTVMQSAPGASTSNEWMLDSGSDAHISVDRTLLTNIHEKLVSFLVARGHRVEAFACDQGREFVNVIMQRFLEARGVYLLTTKRFNINIINITPTKALDGISPYQKLYSVCPDVSSLRTWGCVAVVHQVRKLRGSKLENPGLQALLMGFADTSKGYRLLCLNTGNLLSPRGVKFMEGRAASGEDRKRMMRAKKARLQWEESSGNSDDEVEITWPSPPRGMLQQHAVATGGGAH